MIICNIRLAGGTGMCYIVTSGEFIAKVGEGSPSAEELAEADTVVDGQGLLALPGAIDCHVHFREPGMTAKATIGGESRAAVAGGVTSFLEMPNTLPPTVSIAAWQQKMDIAAATSAANYAFFLGATADNVDELVGADYSRIPGIKLFLGSSTGNLLVDSDSSLRRLFAAVNAMERVPRIAVHAEDNAIIAANAAAARCKYPEGVPVEEHSAIRSAEACIAATQRLLAIAADYPRLRLHLCHVSTPDELAMVAAARAGGMDITTEVSPHHLLFDSSMYGERGTRIKMNPSVKSPSMRRELLEAVKLGMVDIIATDHAPHRPADKSGDALTAASGAPMVQFSLPAMLSLLPETMVQRLMCENPARVYGIDRRGRLESGCYADIVLVEEVAPYVPTDADVLSACGWTPLASELRHRVALTVVNGKPAADATSKALKFNQ